MHEPSLAERKGGLIAATLAYVLWGILPIYWKLLLDASAYEIMAHRVIWSFVFITVWLILLSKFDLVKRECGVLWREKKRLAAVIAGGVIVSSNWLTYIWAVNHEFIVETSLGYYINPLVSVAIGVLIFKEKISRAKTAAFFLAAAGIVYMTAELGYLPWIALYLALSFATYGALKKYVHIDPIVGIGIETLFVTIPSLAYVLLLHSRGESHFLLSEPMLVLLLMGAGLVTAVPLVLFARGVNQLPLNVVGFLQYSSPTIALLIGVFVYDEPFTMTHAVSFGCIWLALILFSSSEWRQYRRDQAKRNV